MLFDCPLSVGYLLLALSPDDFEECKKFAKHSDFKIKLNEELKFPYCFRVRQFAFIRLKYVMFKKNPIEKLS